MNISGITLTAIAVIGLIILGLWGCPQYNVYMNRKSGEAKLAEAQNVSFDF